MGRYTLILCGIWLAFAAVFSIEFDQRMLWAALLPALYLAGMKLLRE